MIPLIGIAAAVLVVGAIAWLYNRLVGLRNKTRYTWADCDAVLTRRAQAIPRLRAARRRAAGGGAGPHQPGQRRPRRRRRAGRHAARPDRPRRLKTHVGDGEHGPDLLLERGDASIALADHETPVVAIVESVLKDEPIPLGELGERLGGLSASQRTSNAARKSHFISARGTLIKAERRQFRVPRADLVTRLLAFLVFGVGVLFVILGAARFADHAAWSPMSWMLLGGAVATFGFLVLTAPRSVWVSTRREAMARISRWEAFRRYLEELPRLSDESPITLPTWEKLLVYATAFGCAERVAEAARLRVGEIGPAGSGVGTSGALLYGPWAGSVMAVASVPGLASSTSLYSDLGGQVSAGATAPSSSGSGGGGGGSFGGGGGGAW